MSSRTAVVLTGSKLIMVGWSDVLANWTRWWPTGTHAVRLDVRSDTHVCNSRYRRACNCAADGERTGRSVLRRVDGIPRNRNRPGDAVGVLERRDRGQERRVANRHDSRVRLDAIDGIRRHYSARHAEARAQVAGDDESSWLFVAAPRHVVPADPQRGRTAVRGHCGHARRQCRLHAHRRAQVGGLGANQPSSIGTGGEQRRGGGHQALAGDRDRHRSGLLAGLDDAEQLAIERVVQRVGSPRPSNVSRSPHASSFV